MLFCPHNDVVVASTSRGLFPKLSSQTGTPFHVFSVRSHAFSRSKNLMAHMRPKEATMRSRWCNDNPQDWHMYRERFTRAACFAWRRQSNFLEQSVLPGCRKKELSAHRFSFSLFSCLCVPQSFRAASFIYNLFVLAVVCQRFFLRRFLPSAHAFLTSISDSLAKLLCTAHSCLSRSFSFFMQNKQHLLQTALHY